MKIIECSGPSGDASLAHEVEPFLERLRSAHEAFVASDQQGLGSLEEQLQRDMSEWLRLRLQKDPARFQPRRISLVNETNLTQF